MNANQYLDFSEIETMIAGTWSNIDAGMLELITNKMAKAKMTTPQVTRAIAQVAESTPYRPGLNDFMRFIPRHRYRQVNLTIFDLTFPNVKLLAEFDACYSRADWEGCGNVLRSHNWHDQQQLVEIMLKQLAGHAREKQQRIEKSNNQTSKEQIMQQFAGVWR